MARAPAVTPATGAQQVEHGAQCDHRTPWLVTRLPDGHVVHAHPEPDATEVERLHDLVHLLVAKALNQPGSPGLTAPVGLPADPDVVAYEEAAVLAIVAYCEAVR